jgi:hypothetical protein
MAVVEIVSEAANAPSWVKASVFVVDYGNCVRAYDVLYQRPRLPEGRVESGVTKLSE